MYTTNSDVPKGFTVDPARLRLHRDASALMAANPRLQYVAAVKAIEGQFFVPEGFTVDPHRLAVHRTAMFRSARTAGGCYIDAVRQLASGPAARTEVPAATVLQPATAAPAWAAPTGVPAPLQAPAAAKPPPGLAEQLARWIRLQHSSLADSFGGAVHSAWVIERLDGMLSDPAAASAAATPELSESIQRLRDRCAAVDLSDRGRCGP